jgi:hypothetical protein
VVMVVVTKSGVGEQLRTCERLSRLSQTRTDAIQVVARVGRMQRHADAARRERDGCDQTSRGFECEPSTSWASTIAVHCNISDSKQV